MMVMEKKGAALGPLFVPSSQSEVEYIVFESKHFVKMQAR